MLTARTWGMIHKRRTAQRKAVAEQRLLQELVVVCPPTERPKSGGLDEGAVVSEALGHRPRIDRPPMFRPQGTEERDGGFPDGGGGVLETALLWR